MDEPRLQQPEPFQLLKARFVAHMRSRALHLDAIRHGRCLEGLLAVCMGCAHGAIAPLLMITPYAEMSAWRVGLISVDLVLASILLILGFWLLCTLGAAEVYVYFTRVPHDHVEGC